MFVDISKLETGTTRFERTFAAEGLDFDYRECRLAGEWTLTADVSKNARDEVTLKARVRGFVEAPCDRCLETFRIDLDHRFETYLVPSARIAGHGKEVEVTHENADEVFYTDPRISLADTLVEQVMLALPAKLLCRENCAGLCPGCGENLNAGPCACAADGDDPRLLLIREMRKRMKEK